MIQVYKDASGMPRWVAVTSNAYRDRDGEIVSSEALKKAVAYGDATGERGPLRFWHVPGLDIGTTDYQATTDNGRFLVESGLITNPAMAKALSEKGADWQMSIGFNHPASQPDGDGVFKDISIFERSITPPNKAANPFTSFSIKGGKKMLTKEKLAALKELLGDSPELTNMLAKVAQTDKAAQDAGIAFKEVNVSEQDKHIAALEQRLYEMQQQLLELQADNTATALKHYKAGSGPDGYGHTHTPGDYLDYGHDTSPDMIEARQRQAQKAGKMGMTMMNPYQMKGRGMGMMNPYEMKGRGMGMMNPYEMKQEMDEMGMDEMDMGMDDMDMGMDEMEMGMDDMEMKGRGVGMMNPYQMKQDMPMGGGAPAAPAAPAGPAPTDMLLTAEEMTALADAVAERLLGKLEDINMKMAKVDEELKGRGYARTKEVQETTEALEKLVEHAEATQDEIDALRAMNEELLSRTEQAEQELVALKEASSGGTRVKSSEVADILAKAEQLEARLKELEGDQPAAAKRPSESRHNVVSSTTVKELRPADLPPGLNNVEQGAYEFIFKK